MNGTYWVKQSALVVVVAVALASPARAATPDAWITTKTKLALLTTEGVSGTAIHVDTILGKVTLHGKVRSAEEKAKAESIAKKDRRRAGGAQPFAGRYPTARKDGSAVR